MASHNFLARWVGVCRSCTTQIKIGDRIHCDPNGEKAAYVHAVCPQAQLIQAGGVAIEAIRARYRIPGSRPAEILIPSCQAVAAATIAARAVAVSSPAPVAKVGSDRRQPIAMRRGPGGRSDRGAADPRLPPAGTAVTGRFKGQVFEAEILGGGPVRMEGVEYPTISAAAKHARGGIPTSGFVFFGLEATA